MKNDHQMYRGRSRVAWATVVCVASLGLSACASMGDNQSKATMRDAQSVGVPCEGESAPAMGEQFWREFEDPQLNALVERALSDSPSLKLVQARLGRALASANGAAAATGPHLNASVDVTHQQYTANGAVPPPLAGSVRDSASAQLSGLWEFDFFGKNRAALEAALGHARAVQADAQAARVLLASNVVKGYVQLARLNDQLGVAHQALRQREQALRLVQDRVRAGLDTNMELRQSESGLPESRLQIETLQEQLMLARHSLMALVGQPNNPLDLHIPSIFDIKSVTMASSLPTDLLGRRADIAAARWRVEAASQDIDSARSQFYPNVNLVGFAGFSSIGLNRLLAAGSAQWGVGPALRLPLFDGGRLRANLRGKEADWDAAIESYNATVIDAVREVADQLTSVQSIKRQQDEQGAALALSEGSYVIAMQRYEAGLSNYLSVLATESSVLNQRRQGVDLAARALDTNVSLMRALGGGYRTESLSDMTDKSSFSPF